MHNLHKAMHLSAKAMHLLESYKDCCFSKHIAATTAFLLHIAQHVVIFLARWTKPDEDA